jgi:diaminopimelate epimerase
MIFTKMHGLGNNYVFVDLFKTTLDEQALPDLARKVSDVRFGIGSDGLILICPSEKADFRMRIFNADGSEGNNCGNGLRCLAKYVYDHGYTESRQFTIETRNRIVRAEVYPDASRGHSVVREVMIEMGSPDLTKALVPMAASAGDPQSLTVEEPFRIEGEAFPLTCLSMGNPHAVLFVDDVDRFPLEEWGPKVEHSPLFPERVNFSIAEVVSDRELRYRVWERGSGITAACGTGACAAVVAAVLSGKARRDAEVLVHLPGGDLTIRWDEQGRVWKKGPAAYICRGELLTDDGPGPKPAGPNGYYVIED